jgi:hypothetical protein
MRISSEKAILYTEHDTTNEVAFKHLKDSENIIGEEILKKHGNLINVIEDEKQKEDFTKIIDNKVSLNDSRLEIERLKSGVNLKLTDIHRFSFLLLYVPLNHLIGDIS